MKTKTTLQLPCLPRKVRRAMKNRRWEKKMIKFLNAGGCHVEHIQKHQPQ